MGRQLHEILKETRELLATARTELVDLQNRVTLLEEQVRAPAPRRGEKVPPTKLPRTLQELEIGREPRGT